MPDDYIECSHDYFHDYFNEYPVSNILKAIFMESLDPVRILDIGTMTSHSHLTDRVNSTGGAVSWLLK